MCCWVRQMLPDVCIIDDVYRPPVPLPQTCSQTTTTQTVCGTSSGAADSDETIPKRRSFTNEYLLACRQSNTVRRLADLDLLPPRHVTSVAPVPVSDVVVLRDDRLQSLAHLLRRLELDVVCRLYVAGCRLRLDAECQLLLARVSLRSLVLSHTQLRRLPECIFDMPALEVLPVARLSHVHFCSRFFLS